MALAVVLDANVLYPIALTDFFITAAGETHRYRLHWSSTILREVEENLVEKRPNLRDGIARRIEYMKTAVPEALVDPPPELVEAMTNDPDDRHVLATAIAAGADIIVTSNLKHFPPSACEPYGIDVQDPDAFAEWLIGEDPAGVWKTIEAMSSRKQNPPQTADEIVDRLTQDLPRAMETLKESRARD